MPLVSVTIKEIWKYQKSMAERGFISLLPQKYLDCTHHEEGFRENTEIRIQGKGFT